LSPRIHIAIVATLAGILNGCLFGATSARAGDGGPAIVNTGKPGVPVFINGREASFAVVYGDWGLKRPGAGDIIIAGAGAAYPEPWLRGYYPSVGRPPAYGRREYDPVSARPRAPAPTYYRSWSADSAPGPVTEYPPFEPPPVILAPQNKHGPASKPAR
jgi:hypothetical protein